MVIRSFNKKDFDQIRNLLNRSCTYDQFSADILNEKIFDDPDYSADETLVAEDNDRVIGFMCGVRRVIRDEKIGYIKLMAVDPEFRRQGIAREMYQKLENLFIQNQVEKVRIYDVPFNYHMPGIDPRYTPALCFAWRLGFHRFNDTSNLLVSLQDQNWSTANQEQKLLKDNIEIRRATEADMPALMQFIVDNFLLWQSEVEKSYRSDPIAVHIALLNGQVKAFSGHNGNNIGTGWFGPMGTHPDLRGKGIGGILLKRCLQDMKDWGLEYSVIPWVGPIDFYSHYANAVVDRVFWRFEKIL